MWNILEKTDFCISFFTHNNYQVYITNFIKIWSTVFTKKQFVNSIKISNDGLEITDNKLLKHVEDMLRKPEKIQSKLQFDSPADSVLRIDMTTISAYGYPIRLELKLKLGSEQLKVTFPLIVTVKDLNCSQRELFDLMAKKDREIEEYKLEGGRLGLKYLKTPCFSEADHVARHTTLATIFGSKEIPDIILGKGIDGFPESSVNHDVTEERLTNHDIVQPNFKQELLSESVKEELHIGESKQEQLMRSLKREPEERQSVEPIGLIPKQEVKQELGPTRKMRKKNLLNL